MPERVSPAPRGREAAAPSRALDEREDALEREADRVADAVVDGAAPGTSTAIGIGAIPLLQREKKRPDQQSEEEKYRDAAIKAGEAFLETAPGKEIAQKATELGEAFLARLPGKVITGTALAGAVTALAATHRELPLGIPRISLDRIAPGLTMKLTYEGPVDRPTKVLATFSLPLGAGERAERRQTPPSEQEKFRAETARMAREQEAFREGLKTPEERERDRRMLDAWISSRRVTPGIAPLPPGQSRAGRAPSLLPPVGKVDTSTTGALASFSLSGETREKPAEEERKKKDEPPLRRKPASHAAAVPAPPVVGETLRATGRPLDAATRARMESRFGVDFGTVRIHTDAQAARSAEAVDALAYTVGDDLVFAAGAWSPGTPDGQRLIAHELAHVVQQSGEPPSLALSPTPVRLARKKDAATPEPDPVDVALNGDDDAVRALTLRSDWEFKVIRPDEAAILLIHLLDGATLDDDEQAGLRILAKEVHQLMLDATLVALDKRGRFRQLLDDYHGAEYRDLLKLLSENIAEKSVKGLYLDAFIAMWWVREHEEKAIVVLLERTTLDDQFDLLMEKNRLAELRKAIDNDDPRRRYEIIVAAVNAEREQRLSVRLSAIFEIDAKASVTKGQRTQEEVNTLLERAAQDLANELLRYRHRVQDATKGPKVDPGKITKINREFEKRLRDLIDQKKAEFGLELKYNVEFNEILSNAFGHPWTKAELRAMDERILSRIPPDILHANPEFHEFGRAEREEGKENEWVAGTSYSDPGRIELFHGLELELVAHELGHQFHDTDELGRHHRNPFEVRIFREFAVLSRWERLESIDFVLLARDEKDKKKLEKMMEQLDKQREKNERSARVEHDGYFYRYNRYQGLGDPPYYRYSKNAKFIRDYAATDPKDDFADTFGYYIAYPETLQKECPDKYAFMHVKVFTGERLLREGNRILKRFDDRVDQRLTLAPEGYPAAFRNAYTDPLRLELDVALNGQRVQKTREAEQSVRAKPAGVPPAGAAEQLARPYLDRLDRVLAVLHRAAIAAYALEAPLDLQAMDLQDEHLAGVQKELGDTLTARYRDELLKLVDAPAKRALAGQAVDVLAWPELDALRAKYRKAIDLLPSYLPLWVKALQTPTGFMSFGRHINDKYKSSKKRPDIIQHVLAERDAGLLPEVEAWKTAVLERIRNGVPFDSKQVKDPLTILARWERKWEADAARIAARRHAAGDAEPAPDGDVVREGLDAPGRPLDADTRDFMEARFGADFGDVRLHTGAEAARSAAGLDAQAFTVGEDIVLGDSVAASDTEPGRALLAHELTHVVQQRGTEPPADERPERSVPPLSFEQIDLPQPADASGDAARAIAPLASAPSALSAEVPSVAPVEAEPPSGENTVAAAPLDGVASSPLVVPPSHPSEQEAERVSRAVVAEDADRWPVNAPPTRSPGGRVLRQGGPRPDKPQGIDVVFIMGVDRNPRRNPFYAEAAKYFKAKLSTATLINDDKHRSLESVFGYLRNRGERVATLYLVSHANEDGTLSFKLRTSDTTRDPHVQYGELNQALTDEPAVFSLPKGVIDRDTRIEIKGCNIGRSTRMLDALDKAFGGKGTVIAPTHKQVFGTETTGRGQGKKVEHYQALDVYYIEYKGNQKIAPVDQQAAFIAKYSELPTAQWEKWVPVDKRGRGGATRQLISIPYPYRYNVKVRNKDTKRMAEDEALPKAVAWGTANIARAEMFEWRIASSTPTGWGWFVRAVAEKTNYVVDRILVDAAGKRLERPETDPKYFGTSTFGDDAKKTARQAAPDTSSLMAERAAIVRALPELPAGDERDEKLARKREIEATLAQRSALVDVHVVKTEDWLGADEVYVTVSGGSQRFKSPVTDLNDGQSGTFAVPLTALAPFDRPVTLQVFDEDLGWFFDRDDLIVTMEWRSPFEPATNKESLDEADYRVRAHL